MFSGPIYYNHTVSDQSDHHSGDRGASRTYPGDLSSQYAMKYGWSIIDDVKVSDVICVHAC